MEFRKMPLQRMGGVVSKALKDLGFTHKILMHQAGNKWDEVVGEHIAKASAVDTVRDGILFVCCKNSVWCNELMLHKEDIIKRLNKAVGSKVITEIRFTSRGFKAAKEKVSKASESSVVRGLNKITLNTQETQKISQITESIPSEELSFRIQKAIQTAKRLREYKLQEGWKPCNKCGNLFEGQGDICKGCI